MDRFDEMAVALVNKWLLGNEPAKIADIAAALRDAATVPEGYVRTGTTDHKLLGTLPMTADGCVVGINYTGAFYREPICGDIEQRWVSFEDLDHDYLWFSTREAAEAAKEATNG